MDWIWGLLGGVIPETTWGLVLTAVVYIALQLKKEQRDHIKMTAKEFVACFADFLAGLKKLCVGAWANRVIDKAEAQEIWQFLVSGLVIRPGMLAIEIIFSVVPAKSVTALVALVSKLLKKKK